MIKEILKKATGGKGIAEVFIDGVNKFVRTPEEKAEQEMQARELEHKIDLALQEYELKKDQELNDRIKQTEGTAKDLQGFPVVGPIIIFLRGAFRPLFSYFVAYALYMFWDGGWSLDPGSEKEANFYLIVEMILLFFFGERTVKNIAPSIGDIIRKK